MMLGVTIVIYRRLQAGVPLRDKGSAARAARPTTPSTNRSAGERWDML